MENHCHAEWLNPLFLGGGNRDETYLLPCVILLLKRAAALKQTRAASGQVTHSQFASSRLFQHCNLEEEYITHTWNHAGINVVNPNACSIKTSPGEVTQYYLRYFGTRVKAGLQPNQRGCIQLGCCSISDGPPEKTGQSSQSLCWGKFRTASLQ